MKITTRRGLPIKIKFTITDNGDPIDLTGGEVELAITDEGIAYALDDSYKVFTKTLTGLVDGDTGIVEFDLDANDMDIQAGKYFYDLYITTPADDYATTLGEIRILPRSANAGN